MPRANGQRKMKHLVFITLLLSTLSAHADYAQIHDADGHTHLRQQPDSHSRVLDKIPTGTYVYLPEADDDSYWRNGWRLAYDLRNGRARQGWVHTSRLIPVSSHEQIPLTATADGFSCLKNGSGVRVKVARFDYAAEQHRFTRGQYGLTHYRGQPVFGTDGTIPQTHYREIAFVRNGQAEAAARSLYGHLFNPYFDHPQETAERSHCHYRAQDDTWFLTAVIADGAAYSEVLFVFRQGRLQQVLASLHPEV